MPTTTNGEDRAKIERWRIQAEVCRTKAEWMKTLQGRLNLLEVAQAYEDMADRAEENERLGGLLSGE